MSKKLIRTNKFYPRCHLICLSNYLDGHSLTKLKSVFQNCTFQEPFTIVLSLWKCTAKPTLFINVFSILKQKKDFVNIFIVQTHHNKNKKCSILQDNITLFLHNLHHFRIQLQAQAKLALLLCCQVQILT